MYRRISLPAGLPSLVESVVRNRVDLFCSDVNAMLRTPLPVLGIEAGCNFASLEVLCSLISGVSRVFLSATLGSGKAFRDVLAFYPDESAIGGVAKSDLIDELYETYRCNFTHSLGINVPDPSRGQPRTVVPLSRQTKVLRVARGPWPDALLRSIEADGARPAELPPTLFEQGGALKLCVESLYWGVRQLVIGVCRDQTCIATAVAFLAPTQAQSPPASLSSMPPAPPINFDVSSSAAVWVSSTTGSLTSAK